ncbi:Nuclear rim protein 1 [Saccharomyces pastorianus]|uniref:Nuclear rim protein 1 n=1 Tax=Saccharomyces pastorianus TaxID=27292 RepID=A0A6C1E4A6_SACPS|nr:NUR1-like protein [Saccharomyces eubayanus]KOH00277.1 NUR1-like protein [Saccharomyces eubayanus]QID84122.1 Nuclear rim protein 1 [Saccharomyces pastorianus]
MNRKDVVNEVYDDSDLIDEEGESRLAWIKRWYQLITSPLDLQLVINEQLEMIDWDVHAKSLAKPLGNFLTVCFFVMRLLQDNLIKPNYYKLNVKSDAFDLSKSNKLKEFDYLTEISSNFQNDNQFDAFQSWYFVTLRFLDNLFKISIFALLSLNFYLTFKFIFGYFKTYNLFHLKNELSSPNLTKHSLSDLRKEYYEDIYKQSLWSMLKHFFRGSRDDTPYIDQDEDEIFYQLKKWTPTKFITNFIVSFSPTAIVFLSFSEVSFTTAISLILHQYVLNFVIIKRFQASLEDGLILSSAALQEYEDKHIMTRVNRQASLCTRSNGGGTGRFGSGSKAPKVFTTHSLNGEEIREVYNYKKKEFEVLPSESENISEPFKTSRQYFDDEPQNFGSSTDPGEVQFSPHLSPYFREKISKNNPVRLSPHQYLQEDETYLSNQDQNRSKSLSPLRQTPLSARMKSFEDSEFSALNKHDINAILRSPNKIKYYRKK